MANEWKPFVGNCVVEIKEKTMLHNWFYCNSKENPADKLTRGMSAKALINDKVWMAGPSRLSETEITSCVTNLSTEIDLQNVSGERRCIALNMHVESSVSWNTSLE